MFLIGKRALLFVVGGSLGLIGVVSPAGPAYGDEKAKTADAHKGKKHETLETLLQEEAAPAPTVESGSKAGVDAAAPPAGAKVASAKTSEAPGGQAAPAADKKAAAPVEPGPPPTDDNDSSEEAARPGALQAVHSSGQSRHRGPYELGALDCRVLDGAGVERLLPKKVVAGEEPDLLCRIVVTQPPTVMSDNHAVTLTVNVGGKETFRQVRTVRMSSIGRRALVFVVPADKVASYDATEVHVHAALSSPALPGGGRDAKFVVEPED